MAKPIQPPESHQIRMVYVDPGVLMMIAVAAGFVCGFLMVALDPWLRFPEMPMRLNWRDAVLTASVMGSYAAVLGWLVTTFWRSWLLWVVLIMLTPLIAGMVAVWNNINAVFGIESDFLIFLPVTLVFNLLAMGLIMSYLHLLLRRKMQRKLAYTALPVVIAIMSFLCLGRLRWSNADAKDVVLAVDTYAGGLPKQDYSIEFLGIRYDNQVAPTGDALLHTEDGTLSCRVRLFPDSTDISCIPK